MRRWVAPWVATACACLALASAASAHVASNGFLTVEIHGTVLEGSLELAVRDVELAIALDTDGDGKITWKELHDAEPRLTGYLRQQLAFSTDASSCPIIFGALQVNTRIDGNYAWLPFTARCTQAVGDLTIRYEVLEHLDPSHRGLLTLRAGSTVQAAVVGGSEPELSLHPFSTSPLRVFQEYLRAGIGHILSGIDHLLFLFSLLLPAVLVRQGKGWQPVAAARPALISILKVVTAFTLAHSITLTLAALDVVRLPSRLTESVIAASIVIAALNNIFPVVTESRARIAFAFGLLHGFGFASVLSEMGLPPGARILSLFAFNLGIETGQLAVVLAVMPCIYALRKVALYRRTLVPVGSAIIAAVALVWLVQRATAF
jgi:hypothetical protein